MLNLVVSCDIPGRAQDCMILLRAKTEIAPTINSDAGSSLIDRPILFICAESVLNEGQSFFCRETFTIPPQLRSCSEVSVKFTCEHSNCNKEVNVALGILDKQLHPQRGANEVLLDAYAAAGQAY